MILDLLSEFVRCLLSSPYFFWKFAIVDFTLPYLARIHSGDLVRAGTRAGVVVVRFSSYPLSVMILPISDIKAVPIPIP